MGLGSTCCGTAPHRVSLSAILYHFIHAIVTRVTAARHCIVGHIMSSRALTHVIVTIHAWYFCNNSYTVSLQPFLLGIIVTFGVLQVPFFEFLGLFGGLREVGVSFVQMAVCNAVALLPFSLIPYQTGVCLLSLCLNPRLNP